MADYLQISLFDVLELTIIEFYFYLREAFIYNKSMTQDGIDYLKNARRLEITEPDRKKIRKKIQEEEH